MEVKTIIAIALVLITVAALLAIASPVVNDSSNNLTDRGQEGNTNLGCIFGNPSQADNCVNTDYENTVKVRDKALI